MSRVYQRQPATATNRATAAARSPQRPAPATSSSRGTAAATRGTRGAARGGPVVGRGQPVAPQPIRPTRVDDPYRDNERTNQPERTVHVGSGYQMFTPPTAKREQMRRQAENEQREYEAHVERSRLRGLREVHRLGGDALSEEEVRRRQAEKYRLEKFARLEKSHQNQSQKKSEEEREIETKKQIARHQAMENEKRDHDLQLRSMRPTVHSPESEASGWTDETREQDRKETMNRFLGRFTQQTTDTDTRRDDHDTQNQTGEDQREQLAVLREMLPHVDDQTLQYHLEVFHGDIDAIVRELLN